MKKWFRRVAIGSLVGLVLFVGITFSRLQWAKYQISREKQTYTNAASLEIGETSSLEILPLYENAAQAGLQSGHGVSYLIRTDSATILFDLGNNMSAASPSPLEANMTSLGVSPDEIDTIVISHRHPDHVGGQNWWTGRTFSLDGTSQPSLGEISVYVPEEMSYPSGYLTLSKKPAQLAEGVATTGLITYAQPFPIWLATPKGDEQALAVNVSGKGIVLITGCGHMGLKSLLARAEVVFDVPVVGVVGGLHYGDADIASLQPEIQFVKGLGPFVVALSPHDSSPAVLDVFSQAFPAAYQAVVVGQSIQVEGKVALPLEDFQPVNTFKIPAPALENNLIGEATEREIRVYLPPSYGIPDKRFPVIYYLPGYGDGDILGIRLPDSMDALIQNGKVNEMIVVVANGINRPGGSFYVNSPVTGNWEDFIVQDVVGYMDSHYRTLAQAESRGITGHSMGGFGALNIAMHHPEVFSAVYSMSPGLFDEDGLSESQIFESETLIRNFIKYEGRLAVVPLEEAQQTMFPSPQPFALSYGLAFAPNPDRHPPYYDYPFTEVDGQLVRDDKIWQRWESGFGGIADEAKQYKENFLNLKGIVVDYGKYDEYNWIPKGCIYFGEQLSSLGIPVKVDEYNGSHQSELGIRIRDYMFPYFSSILKFE
jgi:S-formylglutathione hydrolase